VSDTGHRCGERVRLEFDHVEPVARGGRAKVAGLRLRCRAHNQYEAERAFGEGFMEHKRREHRRAQKSVTARHETESQAQDEVTPWLLRLGIGEREAREAVARAAPPPDAPLEERVRLALRQLGPPHRRNAPVPAASA
jgi:hypothetical protein